MNALYGLYTTPDSAQRAVDGLRASGVKSRDLAVMTSEPFDEYAFGRRDATTRMPWLAALGGLIGGASGYGLAVLTQRAYPIPTGGMPLAPLFTNGIITYELIMLGAILASLLTLLISARLPNVRAALYDPAVSDGMILVGVLNPEDSARSELEHKLRDAGPYLIKEFPRA